MTRGAVSVLLALLTAPLLAQDQGAPPVEAPAGEAPAAPALPEDAQGLEPGLYARLQTNMGVMILRLEPERAPLTTANFVGLIEGTRPWTDPRTGQRVKRPFYDGLGFHRIIDGFMIQGGCPLGTGMGNPGYAFQDEFHPDLKHTGAGILSMANSGPATNGSQFFITLGPTPHLDRRHSIFGHVVRGKDVLERIGKTPTGAQDRPVNPVTIEKATVLRVGPEAQAWALEKDKPVPACEAEADPARTPGAEQAEQTEVKVKLICLQYIGASRCEPHVTRSKDEALERARQILAHARAKGADMDALARRWSDLAAQVYPLSKQKTDPSFAPAFKLTKGQVSEPVTTPFGVIIFEGQ